MRKVFFLAPAAAAAAGLVLSACGGTGGLDAVAKAADKSSSAGSEHVSFTGDVVTGTQVIKLSGSGDFQQQPRLGQASFTISGGPVKGTIDEVMKGWTFYMRSPFFARVLPQGKSWVSLDVKTLGSKLGVDVGQITQTSPTDVLPALKKAGSVKKVGAETVGGVQTTHYQAVIDPAKLPNGAQLAKAHVSPFPVDVWIGDDDGLLRRLTISEAATENGQTATTRMTMDLSNYGEQVNVTVPPADQTLDLTGLTTRLP